MSPSEALGECAREPGLLVDLDHGADAHDAHLGVVLAHVRLRGGGVGGDHENGVRGAPADVGLPAEAAGQPGREGVEVVRGVLVLQGQLAGARRRGVTVHGDAGRVGPAVVHLDEHPREVLAEVVGDGVRLAEEPHDSAHGGYGTRSVPLVEGHAASHASMRRRRPERARDEVAGALRRQPVEAGSSRWMPRPSISATNAPEISPGVNRGANSPAATPSSIASTMGSRQAPSAASAPPAVRPGAGRRPELDPPPPRVSAVNCSTIRAQPPPRRDGAVTVDRDGAGLGDGVTVDLEEGRAEQRVAGREVVLHGADRDARLVRHVDVPDGIEAPLRDGARGGGEDDGSTGLGDVGRAMRRRLARPARRFVGTRRLSILRRCGSRTAVWGIRSGARASSSTG